MQLAVPEGNAAERIRYYHNVSIKSAAVSAMAAFACGVELIRAKAELRHGKFLPFLEDECKFTKRTAQKYMALAGYMMGEGAEELILGSKEDASTLAQGVQGDFDGKTLRGIYQEAGIVKASAGHGGRRDGAGRPKKAEHDLAAELKEIEESPEDNLAIANELFGRLMKWGVEERGIAKLPLKAMPTLVAYLKQLLSIAQSRL